MSNHTKGPWEAVEVKEGLWHVLPLERCLDRLPIATLDHHRDGHEPTRTVITPADAKLMAAAPELLAALRMCVQYAVGTAYESAMEAIAKAGVSA